MAKCGNWAPIDFQNANKSHWEFATLRSARYVHETRPPRSIRHCVRGQMCSSIRNYRVDLIVDSRFSWNRSAETRAKRKLPFFHSFLFFSKKCRRSTRKFVAPSAHVMEMAGSWCAPWTHLQLQQKCIAWRKTPFWFFSLYLHSRFFSFCVRSPLFDLIPRMFCNDNVLNIVYRITSVLRAGKVLIAFHIIHVTYRSDAVWNSRLFPVPIRRRRFKIYVAES